MKFRNLLSHRMLHASRASPRQRVFRTLILAFPNRRPVITRFVALAFPRQGSDCRALRTTARSSHKACINPTQGHPHVRAADLSISPSVTVNSRPGCPFEKQLKVVDCMRCPHGWPSVTLAFHHLTVAYASCRKFYCTAPDFSLDGKRRGRYSKPTARTALRLAGEPRRLSGCALQSPAIGFRLTASQVNAVV